MNQREKLASENGMAIEFVNWFFENKKDGCGNVWFMMMAAMWEGWTAREAQVKQLAAENAALKAFGDKLNDMHNDLTGEGTGIQGRAEVACQQVDLEAAMDEFETIKTPATDAILASLRAEGVEMFGDHLRKKGSNPIVCKMIALGADEFAAQLRNKSEVQS